MAPAPQSLLLLMLLALVCAGSIVVVDGGHQTRFARIFSFGDSLTDTGNVLRILGGQATISRPPYGETFFGRPSGRASDGRIMIDFIGESLVVVATKPNVPAFPDAFLDAVAW